MNKKNRTLIITQYFYPENFKSNDMAFGLAEKGIKIDVLCGIPNYPKGRYYKGYSLFKKRTEVINGVRVFRCFQTPRFSGGIWLFLNYLSFVISAGFWVIGLSLFRKYNNIIVHEPSPITQGIPAILLKKLQGIPLYFWVLDLWPDALKSGGGITNKKILSFVDKIVIFIYRNCDKILISSKGFRQAICEKGDFNNKIIYFPNWTEDIFLQKPNLQIPELPNGFKIMLAGNLGRSQNLEVVMKAAMLTKKNTYIKWIILGDGSKKEWLDNFILENDLSNTVYALGRFPIETMPLFYAQADAMLLTLKNSFPHLKLVVPARLQSYMASGKPVLGMIEGGGADLIKESNCGYAVDSTDAEGFVKVLHDKVLSDKEKFKHMGIQGKKFFIKNFSKEKCINHLFSIINEYE